jgi:hypothetical protein
LHCIVTSWRSPCLWLVLKKPIEYEKETSNVNVSGVHTEKKTRNITYGGGYLSDHHDDT